MKDLKLVTIEFCSHDIIYIKFKPIVGQIRDYKEYMDTVSSMLNNLQHKVILIFDGTRSPYMSSEARIYISKYMKVNKDIFSEKTLGTSVIAGSIMSLAVIKALMLVIEKDLRPVTFVNKADAMSWANKLVDSKMAA